ncbi:MAG: hypothetical protein QE278_01810 [Limnobacter sp.]|nr:hypothetical protein [Limnobacter sp.]
MFNKIFEKLTGVKPTPKKRPELDAIDQGMANAIKKQSQVDPLIGAKIGAKEVFNRLANAMERDGRVHIESLLCALGALTGYSCQAGLRAQAHILEVPEDSAFNVVGTTDGKKYFFGDLLNQAIVGAEYSVWALAGGAAQGAGATELPDLDEIFGYNASVLGSEQFGIPRIPADHMAAILPLDYLKTLWPVLLPTVQRYCPNPTHWQILYGLAVQTAITEGRNVINPSVALRIIMECAIPMSKVDLANA